MLAITGRRPDGFHELVSVVAPLAWGDALTITVGENGDAPAGEEFVLECDDAAVPLDGSNLILKAAQAFRAASGWKGGARFTLTKRIPIGAGLGGGSSNAAAALRGLNQLAGTRLTHDQLTSVAAGIGSDCALFLRDGPVIMRGRGERVEDLPMVAAAQLSGVPVLVFKPAFAISTAWAYGRLASKAPASYLAKEEADARLSSWLENNAAPVKSTGPDAAATKPTLASGRGRAAAIEELLFNNMEPAAFEKIPALPLLLDQLRREFRLAPRMSGSGSACFALLPPDAPVAAISETIRRSWGDSAIVVHTHLA